MPLRIFYVTKINFLVSGKIKLKMCWKIELLDKRMVLLMVMPQIVSKMMQLKKFHQHQIEVNPFRCGNLRRV